MRNMSFAMTVSQIRNHSKGVTRRLGWRKLKTGDQFQPVVKCMGLRKGEKIRPIGSPLVVVSVVREPLRRMIDEPEYGQEECRREGFPEMSPEQFVEMFCAANKRCTLDTVVTRIEFTYL
jgi:hypothetical protein